MSKISNPPIDKIDGKKQSPKTRRTILDLIKREGEVTTAALADILGLTTMAVRLHLLEMEGEGLVAARAEARGRGRPQKLWSLTEAAARVFPDAHQGLAVSMIEQVKELFGEAGLAKLIDAHGDRQRAAYEEGLAGVASLAGRVKRLAALRDAEGYMAEARRDGRDWLLIENHCPICSAAKTCTGLCAKELEVFSDALGADVKVTREEHILAGARRCAYRVRGERR